jgi:hypothetical protein
MSLIPISQHINSFRYNIGASQYPTWTGTYTCICAWTRAGTQSWTQPLTRKGWTWTDSDVRYWLSVKSFFFIYLFGGQLALFDLWQMSDSALFSRISEDRISDWVGYCSSQILLTTHLYVSHANVSYLFLEICICYTKISELTCLNGRQNVSLTPCIGEKYLKDLFGGMGIF